MLITASYNFDQLVSITADLRAEERARNEIGVFLSVQETPCRA